MQFHRFVCEICDASAEVERTWPGEYRRPREWFFVRIERAEGWHPQDNAVSDRGLFTLTDAFPGSSRWQTNVTPPQPVALDLCSEECAFKAMQKLHEGAIVTHIDGPSRLTAKELSFVLHYRANTDEDVKTA